MSKKIIRITESELVKKLSNILSEQNTEKVFADILNQVFKTMSPNMDFEDFVKTNRIKDLERIGKLDSTDVKNLEKKFDEKKSKLEDVSDSEYKRKVVTLLSSYEGFRSKAYQDAVGVWTIGYGSTYVDGKPVKSGDTITKEKAMQQKYSDIDKFKNKIISQIGQSAWDSLDLDTRVVLTSIAYNYGSLPKSLVAAVNSGNKSAIHNVIKNELSQHNRGINRWRREDEAMILATGESKREPQYNA